MFNYSTLSPSRRLFIDAAVKQFPDLITSGTITRQEIQEVVDSANLTYPQWFCHSGNSISRGVFNFPIPDNSQVPVQYIEEETDEEIASRIDDRFNAIDVCVRSVAFGDIKSMILSGPPGIGKTFEINKTLQELDNQAQCNFVFVSGRAKATGLFKTLYDNRFPGTVLVLDDIDSIFDSEDSLNILKKACDLRNSRKISWLSEAKLVSEEDGEDIPKTFDYEGSIIFITNKDFDSLMRKDNKLSSHLDALISRSLYINLGINNTREILVRIKQVVERGMLREKGFSVDEENEILSFVTDNVGRLREVSLRMCEKLSKLYRVNENSWKNIAAISCFKK